MLHFRGGNMNFFFVNADFVLRSVAGLITHVCDFRQLAFWHGKQLAESVDYLPK